jgi:hypothetical protein
VTPVEIADHAAATITRLEVEVLDALRESDEFGPVFGKLDGWVCTIKVDASEWVPLNVMWRKYENDALVSLVVHVGDPSWAHVEKGDMAGIEAWIPNGTEMRWPDIAAAVDAALAEFEKLKEGINV